MKSIHIRDIEEITLERLKRLARSHKRSLQGELLVILERAAQSAPEADPPAPLRLHMVEHAAPTAWRREGIYESDGR